MSASIALRIEACDDGYFADSDETPGCWGYGATPEEAADHFCRVFVDWYDLKWQDGDDDLPPSDWTFTGATR